MPPQQDRNLVVLVGAQRTGTNLLREVLNTHPEIALLGEVFTPSAAPAHWDNFAAGIHHSKLLLATVADTSALLTTYFDFVEARIRNFWTDGAKRRARAIGVDIKYNQLRSVEPLNWASSRMPYLLDYLMQAGAIFIHVIRRNVIQCAVSAMVAEQRNLWHDYIGTPIDRSYEIDPYVCLEHARSITRARHAFVQFSSGARVVECCYEDLVNSIACTDSQGVIATDAGPLSQIANAVGVPFTFRYDGRLRKAINLGYSRLIANNHALIEAVADSEFPEFAATLT